MPDDIKAIKYFFKKIKTVYFEKPVLIYLVSYIILALLYIERNYNKTNYSVLYILMFFLILKSVFNFLEGKRKKIDFVVLISAIVILFGLMLYYRLILIDYAARIVRMLKSEHTFRNIIFALKGDLAFYLVFLFVIIHTLLLDYFRKGVYAVILNLIIFYALTRMGYESINGLISICVFIISMLYAGIHISRNSYERIKSSGCETELNEQFTYKSFFPVIFLAVVLSTPFLNLKMLSTKTYEFWDYVFSKNSQNFSVQFTGFGKNSNLGGKIIPNNEVALIAYCDRPLYLRGSVSYIYTGKSWKVNPILENTAVNANKHGFEDYRDIIKKKLVITPVGVQISNCFSPLYTEKVILAEGSIERNINGIYYNIKNEVIDSRYEMEYYDVNEKNYHLLKDFKYGSDGISENLFIQLPLNLSEKIYNLSDEITVNSITESEKVSKVTRYLIENYKYETDVDSVDENTEFTENFLFEEKEGYCTYFATAAAVLLRCQKVPVRFVEGFLMRDLKDSNGNYIVTNAMAHAWIEVYDENTGLWKTVDPTPAGDVERWFYEQLIPLQYRSKIKPSKVNNSFNYDEIKKIKNEEESKKRKIYLPKLAVRITGLILIIAGILLLSIIIYGLLRYYYAGYYIKKSKSIIPLYRYIVMRIRLLNIDFNQRLTDSENINKIKSEKLKSIMNNLKVQYQREYYGEELNDNVDREKIIIDVENMIKSDNKKIKYYILLFYDCLRRKI